MDMGLNGKVALVCAASRGLGRAIAQSLSAEGALVAICGRDDLAIQATAKEIEAKTGHPVLGVQADLSIPADVERFLADTRAKFGEIDILVNNAGGPPAGGLEALSDEQWQAGIDLGLMTIIRLTKAVVPSMKAKNWGRIITIASTTVQQPKEDLLISSTVRAGVAAFMKAISHNLAPHNVLVHTVCPGPTRTDRMVGLAGMIAKNKGITPEEAERGLIADVSMGRMGRPEEVADLVTALASERLSFSTGLTLAVDGGQVKSLL
ncbi:MAG: 3-oxoacyl-(acyl-carrier-protein) reductase [Cyanobacteria bacterium RYN_339]|nr:3-oxoacyl-(acyl-carrier-protein) reductase [Cyanobacteria bacterium RYN_339]